MVKIQQEEQKLEAEAQDNSNKILEFLRGSSLLEAGITDNKLHMRGSKDIATLEDFARAWNYKNYGKAQGVYGDNIPMRNTPSTKPKSKPKDVDSTLPKVPKN